MTSFQSATLVVAIGVASALAGDALNPPASQWSARAAGAAVSGYQRTISPILARTGLVQCRFSPTCSEYASEALRRRGFIPGAALTTWRLLRCNPFAKGGLDPVP